MEPRIEGPFNEIPIAFEISTLAYRILFPIFIEARRSGYPAAKREIMRLGICPDLSIKNVIYVTSFTLAFRFKIAYSSNAPINLD